eukprot:Protomagalhaensia_sp_Gyna_25__1741@NODE_1912_length_1423_cov_13_961705_g1572_i0_p1_GENE_NODE_1912_length_1423_cov_13_961705_g1572_i0NODE_1912_length_1423_cov_13_961705_g1572_i0_p1_ORF_typecomplete_len447_score53_09Solute_trans_a/PF03619_16/1_8e67_NODE_1912_length_1423_cov_13_961705_g1572_i0771417
MEQGGGGIPIAATVGNEISPFAEPSVWDCFGALLIVGVGVVISASNIFNHLTNYSSPTLQRNIVRILIIAPLYGCFSWLSLVFPTHFVIFDAVRDIWEAVVIYCFMALMMDYAGGELACSEAIENDTGVLEHVFPLTIAAELGWINRRIPMNPAFLKWCRRATLQFVVVKPTMAVMTLWLYTSAHIVWAIWSIVEVVVYNISYSVALYALVLFYLAIKNTSTVATHRPLPKFVAVKVIVFATYWQSIFILAVCPGMPHSLVKRWNSFVLCIECPLAAVLQTWAFPHTEFCSTEPLNDAVKPGRAEGPASTTADLPQDLEASSGSLPDVETSTAAERRPAKSVRELSLKSVVPASAVAVLNPIEKTWKSIRNKQSQRLALRNARDAFGVGDVMDDAVFTFKSRYAKHTRLGAAFSEDENSEDYVFAPPEATGSLELGSIDASLEPPH